MISVRDRLSCATSISHPTMIRPLLAFLCLTALHVWATPITPAGHQLSAVLDAMDVEDHWLAGQSCDWRTGDPDPAGKPRTSFCSSFAAAACERLGIYLLRPPAHGQVLLANAQQAWLLNRGPDSGWQPVSTADQAQSLANQGYLVLATVHNPNPRRPGHIAVLRPADKAPEALQADGPQIIQAGLRNYSSTTVRQGFAGHRGAFANNQVLYFAHATTLPTGS